MARFGVFLLAAVVATALVTPCLSSLAANFLLPLDNLYDELRDCPVCAGIAPKFGNRYVCTNEPRWNYGGATFTDFLPGSSSIIAIQLTLRGHSFCGAQESVRIEMFLNDFSIGIFEEAGHNNCVCDAECDARPVYLFNFAPSRPFYNYRGINKLWAKHHVTGGVGHYSCYDSYNITLIYESRDPVVTPVPTVPPDFPSQAPTAPFSPSSTIAPTPPPTPKGHGHVPIPSPTPQVDMPTPTPTPTVPPIEDDDGPYMCCGFVNRGGDYKSYCVSRKCGYDVRCCPNIPDFSLSSTGEANHCDDCAL